MYKILGLISATLLVVITSPYWVRRLNQWIFHIKGKGFTDFVKTLRKIHKPLGIALVLIALYHGYLALGTLRLHTGSIAWGLVLVTAILGALFYKKKKAVYFTWHKRMALITVLFVLLHLFVPNAVYYLFG